MIKLSKAVTLFLAAALLSLALAPCAKAEMVDGIAAVVNGRIITRSDVDRELALAGLAGAEDKMRVLALEAVIERVIVEETAKRMRISIAEEEVTAAINRIREQFRLDPLSFRQAVERQGLAWEDYVQGARNEMLRMRVFATMMGEELKLDDGRLNEYFLKHAEYFREPSTVRVLHLALKSGDGMAELIRQKVANGGDFKTAAVELSGQEPFDTGRMSVSNLNDLFRAAIAETPEGKLSKVVSAPDGDYLFFVLEKNEGGLPAFEEVKERVRERFTNEGQMELYKNWIEQQKRRAQIQRMS